jgi:hypothetical protein
MPDMTLETGSITQATKVENDQMVQQEMDRVDDQQTLQTIIDSDALQNVDPEDLLKFLEEQETNKD